MSIGMRCLVWGACLCTLVFARPGNGKAQDCGTGCQACGWFGAEGHNWTSSGPGYVMDCENFTSSCTLCGQIELVAETEELSSVSLAKSILRASDTALLALLRNHGNRLLVDLDRGIIVVKGATSCGAAPEAVIFLPPSRMRFDRVSMFNDLVAADRDPSTVDGP